MIMFKKLLSLICALVLVVACAGCSEVASEIAGNVADAAKAELEKQIKATFETYKVEILDMKTAAGKLNGSSEDVQFFCAVLVQSDSDAIPKAIAENLKKLFHDAGIATQSGSEVDNAYLEHKQLTYKSGIMAEDKTYYTVWCYTDKLPTLEDLKNLIPSESSSGVG